MQQQDSLRLKKKKLGAIPLIDHFIKRLELRAILGEAIHRDPYVDAILLLTKSILIEPNALYRIGEWTREYDPNVVYGGLLGDDIIGRALERLFDADRASLLTKVVVSAIKNFRVGTSQVHNDTTSVKFSGAYANQNGRAVQLKRGHSKDHRPDLKQLVYCLSVSADGAIPLHYKSYDGNQTDDGTHWETWQALRGLLGKSDFVYVADSKVCVTETLVKIDRNQGKVVSILPRTRGEAREFAENVFYSRVRWEKLWSKRSQRKKTRIDVFEIATGFYQTKEGFRLYWYRSSEKQRRDEQDRKDRIAVASSRLDQLNNKKRRGPKTEAGFRKAADRILTQFKVQEWLDVTIEVEEIEKFKQDHKGRANEQTRYRRVVKKIPSVAWNINEQGIARAKTMDGIFPLVTNTELPALAVLKIYKYQPRIEKRHSLFKSILEISPVFLKKNLRIEALVFVYFLAQMLSALIERELRNEMAREEVKTLPLLPEGRASEHPSAFQIFDTFSSREKHELVSGRSLVKTFVDPLTETQLKVLKLLSVPAAAFQ